MKSFIFLTAEGFTYQPDSSSCEPDIENLQVLDLAEGIDMEDAFKNMVKDNEYLLDTTFDEVFGLELKKTGRKYFYLNDLKKCSIL
jgi:hypothetical protein